MSRKAVEENGMTIKLVDFCNSNKEILQNVDNVIDENSEAILKNCEVVMLYKLKNVFDSLEFMYKWGKLASKINESILDELNKDSKDKFICGSKLGECAYMQMEEGKYISLENGDWNWGWDCIYYGFDFQDVFFKDKENEKYVFSVFFEKNIVKNSKSKSMMFESDFGFYYPINRKLLCEEDNSLQEKKLINEIVRIIKEVMLL